MQTTPETAALLRELYDQGSIVAELDGPQIEAWVSGLFPVFDEHVTASAFVDYCAAQSTTCGALLVAAIGELTTGLDPATAAHALQQPGGPTPAQLGTIGASTLTGAWRVAAKFGTSIVLGFDSEVAATSTTDGALSGGADDEDLLDLRHSILAELDDNAMVVDLQLTGPAQLLVDEAAGDADRVVVTEMTVHEALAAVSAAWPTSEVAAPALGAGFEANQQFVRRRFLVASDQILPHVHIAQVQVDVRRGLNDAEYADANRAAMSTLQAAVGLPDDLPDDDYAAAVAAWATVVRGDVDDVSPRERDALLWLEWADWLGAGIGIVRAGAEAVADGTHLVDYVNRCPEVSSSIDKADREYAEWAFDVALDLLEDRGVITDDRRLTEAGRESLRHGLAAAWS